MSTGRADEGAGTVLVLGLVAVVTVLAAALALLGQAASARHRAEAAADLAALAAADVVLGRAAGEPCTRARRVATAGRARLTACQVLPDGSVRVETTTTPSGAAGVLGTARAVARAGSAP
jgi:secretion/DNA translocation related TadE-like protein